MPKPRSKRLERIPVGPWLDHLERHLPVARLGGDPEGVHQLRVAAQRLRTWLKLQGLRVLDDDLRWLRNGAGDVRDLDVSMSLVEPGPYLDELRRRWRIAHGDLLRVLDAPRLRALLEALPRLPAARRERVLRATRRWLRKTRRVGNRLDWERAPEEELHAFRRRVRRLRYALDWLGEPRKAVKVLSEELGDVNDLAVLRDRLLRGEHLAAADGLTVEEVTERLARSRADAAKNWPSLARALHKESL